MIPHLSSLRLPRHLDRARSSGSFPDRGLDTVKTHLHRTGKLMRPFMALQLLTKFVPPAHHRKSILSRWSGERLRQWVIGLREVWYISRGMSFPRTGNRPLMTNLIPLRPLRWGFDFVTGYKHKERPAEKLSVEELRKGGYVFDDKQWLLRIIFLESIAGVPGMVAGMLRHLRSLRLMVRISVFLCHALVAYRVYTETRWWLDTHAVGRGGKRTDASTVSTTRKFL
jgi:hypothetical protein